MACGLVLAFAFACAVLTDGASGAPGVVRVGRAQELAVRYYGNEIKRFRRETWYWQRVMGVDLSHVSPARRAPEVARLRELDGRWQRLERRAFARAHHPPNLSAWLCIHRYEASWTDPGAPYYGGLQMDLSFQESYGGWLLVRKGTADHWTPLEQIWTAVKASRVRGFWPWPNSARVCGVL